MIIDLIHATCLLLPGTVLPTLGSHKLMNKIYDPHFRDEETEAQRFNQWVKCLSTATQRDMMS